VELKLLQGAAPFYFAGSGNIGCLCLHGLSASPQEVYWLGKHLAAQGLTVFGARFYGHGVNPDQMLRMRWQDWYLSALDGYHLLRQTCQHVVVLGMSMGGLVAMRLAGSEQVAALIPIAAPLLSPIPSPMQVHIGRYFLGYVAKYDQATDRIDQYVRQLQTQRGEPVTGRVSAWKQSAVGVSEMLRLSEEVTRTMSRITAPTLLIYSEKDTTSPVANIDAIQRQMTGCKQIEVLRLKESEHVITNDVEHEYVNDQVWQFVQKSVANL
jgi:carboxylesterase